MKQFKIIIENAERKQVFEQEYQTADYARISLFHAVSDMLDRAIKESFAPTAIDKPANVGIIEPAATGIND